MSFNAVDLEQARVFCDEAPAGRIERTALGSRFVYEPSFLERCRQRGWGLGFGVPLQPEVVTEGVNLHPFLAGLLPEGLRFEALARATKTSKDDLFSILLAAGSETIGDVRVLASGQEGVVSPVVTGTDFTKVSFKSLLAQSLDYPRSPEQHSIPGVQAKISAQVFTTLITVRGKKGLSPAVLKLGSTSLPRLVQNEAFFMRVAADCGLEVAETSVVYDRDGAPGLLVKRFDRQHAAPFRLHVEDGCQLMNRYPADKYRVKFQQLAKEVGRLSSAPVLELLRLLQLLAFSYLIVNGDLHARNISLYVTAQGRARLSPAYDLLSTLPYQGERSSRSRRWAATTT